MAQLTPDEFYTKWVPLLADNEFQNIDGSRFEQFLEDLRDSFAGQGQANLQPVPPAVNFDPQTRQLTAQHPLGTGALEVTHNNAGFSAYAPIQVDDADHAQGEWRFRVSAAAGRNPSQLTDSPKIAVKATTGVAGPGSIKSTQISDSTAAGRQLLTTEGSAAQLQLLDHLGFAAGANGSYPAFERAYPADGGAIKYLLDRTAFLAAQLAAVQNPDAPVGLTDPQVEDKGNTFSGKLDPNFPHLGDCEAYGVPGHAGIVSAVEAGLDIQNGRLYIRGLLGDVPTDGVGLRVAASGSRPASPWLTNSVPFTPADGATAATKATAPSFGSIDDTNNVVTLSSNYAYTEVRWGVEGQGVQALASNSICSPGNIAGRLYAYVVADAATNRLQSDTVYSAAFSQAATANHAPTATISVVGGSSSLTTGQSVTLQLDGQDSDQGDSVTKLELLDNGVKISGAEIAGSSGMIQSPALAAGTHNFTARATDSHNATGLSSAVVVTAQAASAGAKKAEYFAAGNSLVEGYEASNETTKSMPAQLFSKLSSSRFNYQPANNVGHAGCFITGNQYSSEKTVIEYQLPLIESYAKGLNPAQTDLVIIQLGSCLENDAMFSIPLATCIANYQAAVNRALAIQSAVPTGIEVRVTGVTMKPNGNYTYGTNNAAGYADTQTRFNTWLLANWQSIGLYNLTNYGADSRDNNVNDSSYYNADKQHKTDAGYGADAEDNVDAMNATAAGIHLTPPATVNSTTNNTSTTGSGYTASNLTASALTYSTTLFQTSVSNTTATLTSTANANSVGYSAGIRSKLGIGPSSATVRGWVEFDLYASEVEFVAGLYSANGEPTSVYAYDQINFAFNLQVDSNANGVRPFGVGTGSTAGTTANFTSFADGTTVRIAVEQARMVWYQNGKEVFEVGANDASTYYFQVAFKGAGANIRNVRMAADNLVDSGRPAYAAPAASTATPTAGYASWFKSDTNVTAGASSFSWGDAASSDVASTSSPGGVQVLQSALNGFPAVRLTSTALDGTSNTGPAGTSPFQFLLVGRLPSGGSDNNFNLMGYGLTCPPGNSSVDYRGKMVDMLAFGQKLCLHTNGNYGSGAPPVPGENSGYSPPAVSYDQFAIYGIRWDGTNGESDNSLVGASTPGAVYRDANAPTSPIRIGGGHFDVSPADFNVGTLDVCEIITRNAYSQSAWDADISYLKARYGL